MQVGGQDNASLKGMDIGGGGKGAKAFYLACTQEKLCSVTGQCPGFLNWRQLNCRLQQFEAIVKSGNEKCWACTSAKKVRSAL